VRLTRDGKHVIFHDSRLEGKTNGSGAVEGLTLAELLALDAGSAFAARYAGERLLSLPAALALARGRINLYLDCKKVDPALLVQDVRDAGMERQVVVFDALERLREVRRISQGKVAVMPKWRPEFGLSQWIDAERPDAVEIDADKVTPEICRTFHARGVKVQAKTLGEWDRREVWEKLLAAGVDWFQTDLAEELLAFAHRLRFPKRTVRIAFHRGANRYAPENTLPAFEKAIRMGADLVEFDVRTSSEGKFFLLHDGELGRTTSGRGALASLPSRELAALDAGSWFGKPFVGVKLPSLDDFLALVRGKVDLYFDAKEITPEALAAALERHGLVEATVVYKGAPYLEKLKGVNPRIRRLPPLGNPADVDRLAEQVAPYAFDTSWSILSKELIERCHGLGIQVFSDAIGRHERIEDYRQAIDWGIDVIQTDHPLRVMRAIELAAGRR